MLDEEVVYIAEELPEGVQTLLDLYCVEYPTFGTTYTIRDFVKNPDGSYGLLLNEIVNQANTIVHPLLNYNAGEQNWNMKDFKFISKNYRLKYRSVWIGFRRLYFREEMYNDPQPAPETIE